MSDRYDLPLPEIDLDSDEYDLSELRAAGREAKRELREMERKTGSSISKMVEKRIILKNAIVTQFLDGHDPVKRTYNVLSFTEELTRSDGASVHFTEMYGPIGDMQIRCYGWEMSDDLKEKVKG